MAETTPGLRIGVLGAVEASRGAATCDVGSPKQRAVLALLALEHRRVVSADRLVQELWGDRASPTALSTLQVYVSRLRRALEVRAVDGSRGEPVVVRRAPGYLLDVAGDSVDAEVFRRLYAAAVERARHDPAAAASLVDEALGLVRGETMEDVVDRLDAEGRAVAGQLDELVLGARELRTHLLLRRGDAAAALAESAALATRHPLRESAHALVVHSLYVSGRESEALAAYEQVRLRLAEELGVDPGPALRRLHGQVLRHDRALLPDATGTPRPVTAPGQAMDTSPDLPMVGRSVELDQLNHALEQARAGRGSVVLVTGAAGLGKTRLVAELVRDARASGARVAWGSAREDRCATVMSPWLEILTALPDSPARRALRELQTGSASDLDGGAAARQRLVAAWAHEVTGLTAEAPLVLVLDDVQWADPVSVAVLTALARQAARWPLLLVVTTRGPVGSDPGGSERARRWLADVPALVDLALTPLDETASTTLVAHGTPAPLTTEQVASVLAQAEGHPYFLLELARFVGRGDDAVGGVPATVRDLIATRLDPLGTTARLLVELAATIGREASLTLATGVLVDQGHDVAAVDAAVDEVVAAGLVEVVESLSLVRFPHDLVHAAVLDHTPRAVRSRWHADLARRLTGAARAQDVALHLVAAGDVVPPEEALPGLLLGIDSVVAQPRSPVVEVWLARARELAGRLPAGPEADLALMGVVRREAARAAVAHGWFSAELGDRVAALVALARRQRLDQEAVDLLCRRVATLLALAELDQIEAEATPLLRGRAGIGHEAELVGRLALGLVASADGRPEETCRHLGRVVELLDGALADGPSWADLTVVAEGALAHAYLQLGQEDRALRVADDALNRAERVPAPEALVAVLNIALLHVARGDHQVAHPLAESCRVRAAERGLVVAEEMARLVAAWAAVRRPEGPGRTGARDRALADLRDVLARWRGLGVKVMDPVVTLLAAEAELETGYPVRALGLVDAVEPGTPDFSWGGRLRDVRLRAARAASGR
ncbi:BTAD domain-containing putative transcriptional regulator [Nocardioides rubriscoriae]|uniref:BTAD domain-containing putative transcriptional regulator n=1 Tax=Nocardioides rubriscoriae TaxID=642762 RepID=UPI001478DFB1|nr:BTAD domain-containing putative transcriptional regulator [Nocardioides rubriscoriae]